MPGDRIFSRIPLILLLVILVVTREAAAQETARAPGQRIALLIDNTRQAGRPAATAMMQTIADQLGRFGFGATSLRGLSRERMAEAVRELAGRVRRGTTVLFLFRGAMLRVGQRNIIMAADATGLPVDDPRQAGIALDSIESDLSGQGAEIKIIVVDAARNEGVAERFGVTPGGAVPLDAHDGTLAILNAGRDRKGDEEVRPGEEDIFLTELLKQTAVPEVTAEQAFAKTRIAVARATAGRQVPTFSSSLLNDFFFGAATSAPAAAPAAGAQESPASPPSRSEPPPRTATGGSVPRDGTPQRPGEIFKDCDTCPDLVVVPAGDFVMGSSEDGFEKPSHRVTLPRPFAIGRHEVTFAQWDACVGAGACRSDIDDHGYGRGSQPVIDVSWDEAQVYLAWLSARTKQTYRLPSESEWEYAARAGSRSAFFWGATAGSGRANCEDCSASPPRAPQAVGSYRPNAFGLFDTAGNAAEWVGDCWNSGYRGAPADGSAWQAGQCQLRVLRGGSFASRGAAIRSSARFRYDHDVRYYTNGFRVVRELP